MKPIKPRRPKLRTRVLVGVLGVTLAALVAFDIAAVTALRGYLIGQTDSQLRSVLNVYRLVNAILPGVGPDQIHHGPLREAKHGVHRSAIVPPRANFRAIGRQAPATLQPFSFTLVTGHGLRAVSPTVTIRGLMLGTNPGLAPRLPSDRQALLSLGESGRAETVPSLRGNQPLRLMAIPTPGGAILVAATSLTGVYNTVGQVELILIIGSAAAGLAAVGGVAWIMRRGLRPIETMATQADAITAGDLAVRVGTDDTRTEVGRLGTALNRMLGRIGDFIAEREASQEATRRFFADASHELRTPLASLRANAELYQQGALTERPQVDEAMRRIAAEAQRMSALVNDMLRLARLDQHPEREHEPVDVTALARECGERAQTADSRRSWHTDVAPDLLVNGDEELLRQALDNLLANVTAHTPEGTAATIRAAERDGSVRIEVSDDGPGVTAARLPRIFDRFYHAAARQGAAGSGLGLAIVAAVAGAHGGSAEAALNSPHGLRVTFSLPAEGQQPSSRQPSQPQKLHRAGIATQ